MIIERTHKMKTIHVAELTQNIREMCIEANHCLTSDMDCALKNAVSAEKSLLENRF